jgi:hypothetical protein
MASPGSAWPMIGRHLEHRDDLELMVGRGREVRAVGRLLCVGMRSARKRHAKREMGTDLIDAKEAELEQTGN